MTANLDVEVVRKDFPIFETTARGQRLVYLDSAATSQKPRYVIDRIVKFYETENANVHRGIYELGELATAAYEGARQACARFIGARSDRSIVFTRGTTEAVNLVRYSWGREHVSEGDEILVTEMEHHSNLVPWQLLCERTGAELAYVPIDDEGLLVDEELDALLERGPKLLAVAHVSNVLGTINPIAEVAERAHAAGTLLMVDGAQAAPHLPLDVSALGADFYAWTGHKAYGPTGIGILHGRRELLAAMPPFLGGGDMIRTVTLDGSTWADLPQKFEAGTASVADAVGLGVAADYLTALGMDAVRAHEREITSYALDRLAEVPGLTPYGPVGEDRAGVASFTLGDVHPHDIASILDSEGIAVRAGHHCAQPLMRRLGLVATTRASFYVYNTEEDVDRLIDGLMTVRHVFGLKE